MGSESQDCRGQTLRPFLFGTWQGIWFVNCAATLRIRIMGHLIGIKIFEKIRIFFSSADCC